MEAMKIRAFSVLLLLSIGGFRLSLAITRSLPYNVTQFVGTNVVIDCSSVSFPTGTPISWIKDRKRNVIYNANTGANSDSSKYSFANGSNTLTVMNAQLTDATTYCCTAGLDDYCSNVVLIDSLTASVNPSNGVGVGDNVNLSCSLIYNAPPLDLDSPFPLSDLQEPYLSMFIGQTEITRDMTGDQVVGTYMYSVPHSIILSYYRTITRDDAGKNLTCQVSSVSPVWSSTTNTTINVGVSQFEATASTPSVETTVEPSTTATSRCDCSQTTICPSQNQSCQGVSECRSAGTNLTDVYNECVIKAELYARRDNCCPDDLVCGVVVTLRNDSRWLIHDPLCDDKTCQMVVFDASCMSSDWKLLAERKIMISGVGDFVQAGNSVQIGQSMTDCSESCKRMTNLT